MLAVPFLDTAFVVLKRIKYRRPVYLADQNHFHHRFEPDRLQPAAHRALPLRAGRCCVAGFAVALRFVPYSDDGGDLNAGWTIVMALLGLLVLAASVYLVYVLEILKFGACDAMRLRRVRPGAPRARSTRTSSSGWRPASSSRCGARPRSSTRSASE